MEYHRDAPAKEAIVEYDLIPEEEAGLQRSAASVQELCQAVDKLLG